MRSKFKLQKSVGALVAIFMVGGVLFPHISSAQGRPSADLVQRHNQFALEFYQQVRDDDPAANLIFSPFSIWQALAMVYAGARGDTEAQMNAALHYDLPQEELHGEIRILSQAVAPPATGPIGPTRGGDSQGDQPPVQVNIANALWGQAGFPFEEAYLNTLSFFYDGSLFEQDFMNGSPVDIAAEINRWIAQATQDKITDLVPPDALTPETRLVLTNAIYFQGAWAVPFAESATEDAPFYLLDGSEVTVPMMYQDFRKNYAMTDTYSAVDLPYEGWTVGMLLILPSEGQFETFEADLTVDRWNEMLGAVSINAGKVNLYVPRFEYETPLLLNDAFAELGVVDAFNPEIANFSGIVQEYPLYISDALHKAYIKVDENGTEAAAATAIVIGEGTGDSEQPAEIRFDRPFIYAIYDKATGTILFVGRVMNPAGE